MLLAIHFRARSDCAMRPLLLAVLCCGAGALTLAGAEWLKPIRPIAALALISGSMGADLVLNNGPNGASGLPPPIAEVLDPKTPQRNHRPAEAQGRGFALRHPPRPGRARRARLPLAQRQPHPRPRQYARLQSRPARPLLSGNRRRGSPSACPTSASSRRCFPPTARRSRTCSGCATSPLACRSQQSTRGQSRRISC